MENENKTLNSSQEELNTENKQAKYAYEHTFQEPLCYNGETYKKLRFNWAKLRGRDAKLINQELMVLGVPVVAPSITPEYLVRMACRCCDTKIGADAFDEMGLWDFIKITREAANFLR